MPTYFARKAGNINATDVWATAPAGTASAVTFVAGDVLMANSFAITVNVSTDLGGAGQVRNDATGGATAGGSFTLSNGVTLTANVFSSASGTCLIFNGVLPNSATLVGNITNTANGGTSANNASTGTLNIIGNVTGGTGGSSHGATNASTGTITITGNVSAGSGANFGATNASTGTITITGNVTGGAGTAAHGANNASTGTLNVTGNCTGGNSTGTGAFQASTGILSIIGTVTASQTAAGVAGANVQQVTILSGPFITETSRGVAPVYCAAWRWNASPSNSTYLEVMTNNLLAKRNLVTADNITGMPAASNVKSGIAYGPSSELTGTFAQTVTPSTADIASAVWGAATRTITGGLVDTATTLTNSPDVPTEAEIATAVRTELATELGRIDAAVSSRLAPNGTLATVTTLTNAPTVPSAADIATQVRTELATELARVDAAVSTRLAGSAYTAPANSDIAAIKGKTDLLETTRLAQCSTVSTTGAQLAAALS